MSEQTTRITDNRKKDSVDAMPTTTEHTCACGETHEDHQPGISHRDSCTSPLKFGNTCCCGSGKDAKARTPCGHDPRCH